MAARNGTAPCRFGAKHRDAGSDGSKGNHMSESELLDALEAVTDEASFIRFAQALLVERRRSLLLPLGPDGFRGAWANDSIEGFLDAALAWAEDADFGARPGPKSSHPWQLFASFLWAGRSYE